MAESKNGWFNSFLNAAKNKSTEVLEFVKKDLEEFGNTVKHEATSVVSTTGSALSKTLKLDESDSTASSMKRSISSFLGQMNTILNPSPDDSDTEVIMITENSDPITLTKLQQAVYNLQKNERTFLDDPDESLMKQFNCWLEIIEDQITQDRLNKHLSSSVTLKNQYEKLVPEQVSHLLFWKRYLFKKALLEDDMARQEAMEKREQKEKLLTEDHLRWEHEDFATDIELSEEEQIRLLEQYEAETKQRKNGSLSPAKTVNDSGFDKTELSATYASPVKEDKLEQKEICSESKINNNSSQENILERNEDHFNFEIVNKQSERKIRKTDSHNSLDIEIKSSNSSSDGDWEKITNDEN